MTLPYVFMNFKLPFFRLVNYDIIQDVPLLGYHGLSEKPQQIKGKTARLNQVDMKGAKCRLKLDYQTLVYFSNFLLSADYQRFNDCIHEITDRFLFSIY